jgi:hypothetical protein
MHEAQFILAKSLFPESEYIHLSEVSDATGTRSRAADGVMIPIWPSRGHHMIGIEIKTSRSDWQKELRNPSKADKFFARCAQWYLVTLNKDSIASPEDVPIPWGHIHIDSESKRPKVLKKAPLNRNAKPLDNFTVTLLRNIQASMAGRVQKALDLRVNEWLKEQNEREVKTQEELTRLRSKERQWLGADKINNFIQRSMKELKIDVWAIGREMYEDREIKKMKQAMEAYGLLDNTEALVGRLDAMKQAIAVLEQSIQEEISHFKKHSD